MHQHGCSSLWALVIIAGYGGVLLAIDGVVLWVLIVVCVCVVVGLVAVSVLWLVVVVCGQSLGLSSWAIVACWWMVVLGVGCGHWHLLLFVCGQFLVITLGDHCGRAVITIHHMGSCCWSLCMLFMVVRRREAMSHCQTNIVCNHYK